MHRTLTTLTLCSLFAAAPTHAHAQSAPSRTVARPSATAPIGLEFRVLRNGATAPSISGQMEVLPSRASVFEQQAPRSAERSTLSIEATVSDDNVIHLRVSLRETSAQGEQVQWDPIITVRRGQSGTASILWNGGGRSIELRVR